MSKLINCLGSRSFVYFFFFRNPERTRLAANDQSPFLFRNSEYIQIDWLIITKCKYVVTNRGCGFFFLFLFEPHSRLQLRAPFSILRSPFSVLRLPGARPMTMAIIIHDSRLVRGRKKGKGQTDTSTLPSYINRQSIRRC